MKKIIIISFFAITASLGVSAQGGEVFSTEDGAIKGYDPVAFFTDNKPVKGTKEIVYTWNGATWHFANTKNRDAFAASPEKYVPQFGGYCAYGVSQNHKSPTDPFAFTVVKNKLYLNYSPKVKELWTKDTTANITKAEKNWPGLKNQN